MEREKRRLEAVVFDLDDTIMPCKEYYVRARAELLAWMSGIFEPVLSGSFGMKKGSLVKKARSVQRAVEKEGSLTRDVYEIIDDFFKDDEDAGLAWSHLMHAIDLYSASRQSEDWMGRAKRSQGMVLGGSPPFLRLGFELLRHASPDSIPDLTLAAMAHAFKLENTEDFKEFRKQGKEFSSERFPLSCRKTYLQMCELLGTTPEWEHLYKAAEIGRRAFEVTEKLMPGTEAMLDYLKLLDVRTGLLTRGDEQENIQWLKYHVIGLDRWIPQGNVTIAAAKTPEHYAQLLGSIPPENSLAIGNDYDGDLHPARLAGMHTLWIPLETWLLDSSEHLDSEAGQPFLAEEGVFGWRTDEGLYTFQLDSAGRVPAVLREYFSR